MLILLGLGLLVLYAILRAPNLYGDPGNWAQQKNVLYSFLSFMNVQKYPPSLLYICATIGLGLLILAWFGNKKGWLANFITVFGRVPFLYYVLHFFLIHLVSAICYLARGHSFAEGVKGHPDSLAKFVQPGEGYSLLVTYLVWIAVVIVLYPVCKWFSEYKKRHKDWWLSYI